MNDFKKLNEIVRQNRAELNDLYKNLDNDLVKQALHITGLNDTNEIKIALLKRIVDLKIDPLENELKKLNFDSTKCMQIRDLMFDFVRELYEKRHFDMLTKIESQNILDEFFTSMLWLIHKTGTKINNWQISWQKHIIDSINAEFNDKFKNLNEAMQFIDKNRLYQNDNGTKADRSYGAVLKNPFGYSFATYAVVFESDINLIVNELNNGIKILKSLAKNDEHNSYINYFEKLSLAFSQRDNDLVIKAWQDTEIAWMQVKGKLQPAHPLEYYEDIYTHAVAPEWDLRLDDDGTLDESEFKTNVKNSFLEIYNRLNLSDENLKEQVLFNIDKTQLYICAPMLFYGAELNGLFSAQVVPNDEKVSSMCGKKIFAFVNYVYESSKAKPFMKLSKEIFSRDFLNYNREILFLKPEIWKKVYEISTIGHEFGHILFIDKDTENSMNKSGAFKFIEEYKATTGGLVNFFLNETSEYKMPVFAELIARSVGLIAWMKVDETRAYYCEGLIHLSLLFESGVLKFKNGVLDLDFSDESYNKFKEICIKNYENLAYHYSKKLDAKEFLYKFVDEFENTFLPKNQEIKSFVMHFYDRYKAIGNDIDDSNEWQIWQDKASKI